MFRLFTFLTFLIIGSYTNAQFDVANLSLSPLEFHPSMAGSSNPRVVSITNTNTLHTDNSYIKDDSFKQSITNSPVNNLWESYQNRQSLLYFDKLLTKKKLGIGAFIGYSYVSEQESSKASYNSEYSKFKSNNILLGVILSTKYNQKYDKKKPLEFLTWSPSISLTYEHKSLKEDFLIPEENNLNLIPLAYDKNQALDLIELSIGSMINSKRLIVGVEIKSKLGIGNTSSNIAYLDTNAISQRETNLKLTPSLSAAYSFPKRNNTFVSFVPKVILRFHQNFGSKTNNLFDQNKSSHQLNLDFRIKRIILGSSFGWKNRNLQNNYIGYKSQRFKATIGTRVTSNQDKERLDSKTNILISELAFNYTL